jgi:hypothetical protein
MNQEDKRSLQIVGILTQCKKEQFGAGHHINWKKTGISKAWFNKIRVCRDNITSTMAKAAYDYLMQYNPFYRDLAEEQAKRIEHKACMQISSFDLFITYHGIECGIFPELYPTADFIDTGSVDTIYRGWQEAITSEVAVLIGGSV